MAKHSDQSFRGHGRTIQSDERCSRRGDFSWIARATSSLPVPVSPRMQTRVSLAATRSSAQVTSYAGPEPRVRVSPALAQLAVLIFEPRQPQRIFNRHKQFSVESGFSKKSSAPSFVAFTAISIFA